MRQLQLHAHHIGGLFKLINLLNIKYSVSNATLFASRMDKNWLDKYIFRSCLLTFSLWCLITEIFIVAVSRAQLTNSRTIDTVLSIYIFGLPLFGSIVFLLNELYKRININRTTQQSATDINQPTGRQQPNAGYDLPAAAFYQRPSTLQKLGYSWAELKRSANENRAITAAFVIMFVASYSLVLFGLTVAGKFEFLSVFFPVTLFAIFLTTIVLEWISD